MSDIQAMARRLRDLEQAKKNMNLYSHPDDVSSAIAHALKLIAGTDYHDSAVALIAAGMDDIIRDTKRQMREALQ